MRAAAAANNSSTRAGIMTTTPAPIIAAARPTCPAFSEISARASANSLPTNLASCAMASPKSSGIERSVCEVIAIALIRCASRCRRRAAVCRTLQETHDAKPCEYCDSQKCGGLPSGERLCAAHQIIEVAIPNTFGNAVDLFGRLADISAGDWKIGVELTRGAAHRIGKSANILCSGRLPIIDGALEFIGRLRGHVLCSVRKIGRMSFECFR